MKKFLLKSALYFTIVMVLVAIVSHTIYAYVQKSQMNYLDYESGLIREQYHRLNSSYNTMFLGTSKTFRQVDPLIFDSLNTGCKSINMGVNNLYPYRSFDYERFISPKCDSIRLIIYELRTIGLIGSNYSSLRNLVSYSSDRGTSLFKSTFFFSGGSLKLRIKLALNYFKFMLYKSSGIGLKRLLQKDDTPYFTYGQPTNRGYFPLDKQLQCELDSNFHSGIERDRNKFLLWKNENSLMDNYDHRKCKIKQAQQVNELADYTMEHLKRCFPKAQVVFVIPPHTLNGFYPNLYQQYLYLKSKGYVCLNFADTVQYPELHQDSTSYDIGHLNTKGANLYTTLISKRLQESQKSYTEAY